MKKVSVLLDDVGLTKSIFLDANFGSLNNNHKWGTVLRGTTRYASGSWYGITETLPSDIRFNHST